MVNSGYLPPSNFISSSSFVTPLYTLWVKNISKGKAVLESPASGRCASSPIQTNINGGLLNLGHTAFINREFDVCILKILSKTSFITCNMMKLNKNGEVGDPNQTLVIVFKGLDISLPNLMRLQCPQEITKVQWHSHPVKSIVRSTELEMPFKSRGTTSVGGRCGRQFQVSGEEQKSGRCHVDLNEILHAFWICCYCELAAGRD